MDVQQGQKDSTLELYRWLLTLRRQLQLGTGDVAWLDGFGDDVVALVNTDEARRPVAVLLNLGEQPLPLPEAGQVLAASGPLTVDGIPTDTAVWLAV